MSTSMGLKTSYWEDIELILAKDVKNRLLDELQPGQEKRGRLKKKLIGASFRIIKAKEERLFKELPKQ